MLNGYRDLQRRTSKAGRVAESVQARVSQAKVSNPCSGLLILHVHPFINHPNSPYYCPIVNTCGIGIQYRQIPVVGYRASLRHEWVSDSRPTPYSDFFTVIHLPRNRALLTRCNTDPHIIRCGSVLN